MRGLYILACVLVAAAIAAELTAKNRANAATASLARAAGGAGNYETVRAASHQTVKAAEKLMLMGFILAGLGLGAWLVSLGGKRRGPAVVPILLLAVYATLYFFVV